MKIFSIDLETTGLNPKSDQILQIGCVYFNSLHPFDSREKKSWIVKWDRIAGHPRALTMNQELIKIIDQNPDQCYYLQHAMSGLTDFIRSKFDSDIPKVKFTAAGKNFASFDNLFLHWPEICKPHHRSLDPGAMYVRSLDDAPPTMEECCERAGVEYDKTKAHDAVYDADIVAECVYNFLQRQPKI
jgi:DNA polymerase III alpha subunit (gram-positive type)